ncbi:armadillo-type protein [Dipodascopsis tothii]|uniref:armadillo-type protein n=1 Tax=Dipodascopsis tothii TaxID=44089 RepID=UPI0034CE4276
MPSSMLASSPRSARPPSRLSVVLSKSVLAPLSPTRLRRRGSLVPGKTAASAPARSSVWDEKVSLDPLARLEPLAVPLAPALVDPWATDDCDREFAQLLDRRGVAENLRPRLQALDRQVKLKLIANDERAAAQAADYTRRYEASQASVAPPRSRHGRMASMSSLSLRSGGPRASTPPARLVIPEEFLEVLRAGADLERVNELRRALRNEPLSWTVDFLVKGGVDVLVERTLGVVRIEWRDEADDRLLHALLLCFKALGTSTIGLNYITAVSPGLFSTLLALLFSDKQPAMFGTRHLIVHMVYLHLRSAPRDRREDRARLVLAYLEDPTPPADKRLPDFIEVSHTPRPYKKWYSEWSHVVRDVFWVFMQNTNRIRVVRQAPDFAFECEREPVRTGALAGCVELDALEYLATHVDLMNVLLASLPTALQRNDLRQRFKDSGFERLVTRYLRASGTHYTRNLQLALETLVSLGHHDGWDVDNMAHGLRRMDPAGPRKGYARAPSAPPGPGPRSIRFVLPELDFGLSSVLADRTERE